MEKINVCFFICGLPRTLDAVIYNIQNLFEVSKYNIHVYISTSICNEEEYINSVNLKSLEKDNNIIKKILFVDDYQTKSFRNSKNYLNKMFIGLKMLDEQSGFDYYFCIRSDCIINSLDFMKDVVLNDCIYFSTEFKNSFTKKCVEKINEQIIVSKNFNLFKTLINDYYNFAINNNSCKNHNSINLYKFLKSNNSISYNLIHIDYKLCLSRCNIIAISGDSASGKTTFSEYLSRIFPKLNVLKFETDRYHKWERGDKKYEKMSHLNPSSNYLEMMSDDLYNLKIGNDLFQVDYDHNTGKFTEKKRIKCANNIIFCGLHTLYNKNLNTIIDSKIFIDVEEGLKKKWKLKRDCSERNYTVDKILNQIEVRKNDYCKYIETQKLNSDFIIYYYENDNSALCCNIIFNNNFFYNRLKEYFIKYNYEIIEECESKIVKLKNNYYELYFNEKIYLKYDEEVFFSHELNNNYNGEILIILILYLSF